DLASCSWVFRGGRGCIQPVGQRSQVGDFQVGADVVARPGARAAVAIAAVDPAGAQAGALRTEHVHLDVVADVQHVARFASQLVAGSVEDAGGGLGRAVLGPAQLDAEPVH